MNRDELIALAQRLLQPDEDVDLDEHGAMEAAFEQAISHPAGIDLINYPQVWGLPAGMNAEQVVDIALSWRPVLLAMQVARVEPHPRRKDLRCYQLEVPNRLKVQVVSSQTLTPGDICAVALSGYRLPDGRVIGHGFSFDVFSVGEVLGRTSALTGTEIQLDQVIPFSPP